MSHQYGHNTKGRASRSGKQHTYTGEGYDSWEGLSPNGRQVKNEITGETRNLSGADYWHARKANKPELIKEPDTWVNGKPNIKAFGIYDEKPKKNKDETNLEYKIFPQQKTLDNIEKLIDQLENQLLAGDVDSDIYIEQREALEAKKGRAWKNLCKAKGWPLEEETETKDQPTETVNVKRSFYSFIPPFSDMLQYLSMIVFILWVLY